MLSIIDTEAQIAKWIPHLDEMVQHGLIAMSTVQVIRYSGSATSASGRL